MNGTVERWLPLLTPLALLGCMGCQRAPMGTPMNAAQPAEVAPVQAIAATGPVAEQEKQPAQPVPDASAIAAEKIFDTLTAHSWTSVPPNQPAFPPMDYSVSSFRADGTFSFEFFTDYQIPAKTGKWNLQFLQGQWFLCQDDGGRSRIAVNDDETITNGFAKLYPHKPLARDPSKTAKTLPPLVLLPEVQEIVRRLTARAWKRTNDLDLRRNPTQVRFRPDWTYVATYRGGECQSAGTWYAKTDEIVATSPTGRCDVRPGTGGDSLTAQVIDDRRVLINGDLYVPENEPVERGILWNLSGFDAAVIQVEYDMPIRRGQPVRFDVTITGGSEPIKLERFSLSRAYSDYGRGIGDRGKELVPPGDEIAGHDLAGIMLDPSKSHTFGLSAEFPDAGHQWIYFNALLSGSTQNWDTHQARELNVAGDAQ